MSNSYQTEYGHEQERKQAGDMSRHVSIVGMSFFIISFFYLLITFFTGSTNVFLCVNHHLDASNRFQTEHGHKQEQETGWRHVKTCLNRWYVFFYYIILLSTYNFFYRFYKRSFTRWPSPRHVQQLPNRARTQAGAGNWLETHQDRETTEMQGETRRTTEMQGQSMEKHGGNIKGPKRRNHVSSFGPRCVYF